MYKHFKNVANVQELKSILSSDKSLIILLDSTLAGTNTHGKDAQLWKDMYEPQHYVCTDKITTTAQYVQLRDDIIQLENRGIYGNIYVACNGHMTSFDRFNTGMDDQKTTTLFRNLRDHKNATKLKNISAHVWRTNMPHFMTLTLTQKSLQKLEDYSSAKTEKPKYIYANPVEVQDNKIVIARLPTAHMSALYLLNLQTAQTIDIIAHLSCESKNINEFRGAVAPHDSPKWAHLQVDFSNTKQAKFKKLDASIITMNNSNNANDDTNNNPQLDLFAS